MPQGWTPSLTAAIAALLGIVTPTWALARWRGWLERPLAPWVLSVASVLALVPTFPDAASIQYHVRVISLFLAIGVVVVLLVEPDCRNPVVATRSRATLIGLCAIALVVYTNFFQFRGYGYIVHFHDVFHLYLGAKYAGEIGYDQLYPVALRASYELGNGQLEVEKARDMVSYALAPAKVLMASEASIAESFSPERWIEFKSEVLLFQRALGDQFAEMFWDHGYNSTPFWTLVAHPLANLVEGGTYSQLRYLVLIDPVLIVATLAAVTWAWGTRTALLSLLYLCLCYGGTSAFLGGAFLRWPWFATFIGGLCLFRKGYAASAGVCLALAALFRVFPAVLVLPLALQQMWAARASPTRARRLRRSARAAMLTGVFGVALTALLPKGYWHWVDWLHAMHAHTRSFSANCVGLLEAVAYVPAPTWMPWADYLALVDYRETWLAALRVLVAAPLFVAACVCSRRMRDVQPLVWGLALLFTATKFASYYGLVCVVLLLPGRRRTGQAAALFAVEALAFLLSILGVSNHELFAVKSACLALLLGWLLSTQLRERPSRPFARAAAP